MNPYLLRCCLAIIGCLTALMAATVVQAQGSTVQVADGIYRFGPGN